MTALAWLPCESPVRALLAPYLRNMPAVHLKTRRTGEAALQDARFAAGIRRDFAQGAVGVATITSWLHAMKQDCVNVEAAKPWQTVDVDLLVPITGLDTPLRVEVKADNYRTGNVALETVSVIERCRPGWMHCSTADVLAYYFTRTDDLFLFDFTALKGWFARNQSSLWPKTTSTPNRDGTGVEYHTEFYPVRLAQLADQLPGFVHLNLTDWLGPLDTPPEATLDPVCGRRSVQPWI